MIIILVSKLSTTYQIIDPKNYIIGNWEELDPIFAGRLAYLAKSCNVKIKLTEGYRSTARQTELYNQYLQYKKTGKGSVKLAAKPGTSWHEFRLAIDTSTQPIRGMNNSQLKQYGLCKPIASEGWHMQPIETSGQTNRQKFEPTWKEDDDMTKEEVTKIVLDILSGDNTQVPAWAKEVWDEATKEKLTDGTRPEGYAKRDEVISMIKRATK